MQLYISISISKQIINKPHKFGYIETEQCLHDVGLCVCACVVFVCVCVCVCVCVRARAQEQEDTHLSFRHVVFLKRFSKTQ